MRAIFLDKDGTLVKNVPHNTDPARVRLCEGAVEGLRLLRRQGFHLFVVTNQPGVSLALFAEHALPPLFGHLSRLLLQYEIPVDGFYYCPHHPDGAVPGYAVSCNCRKPLPGMLLQAAAEHDIDLQASWMIGDILHDVECGRRAGCKAVLIDNGNETEWEWSTLRTPQLVASDLHAAAVMIGRFERLQPCAAPQGAAS